MPSKAAANAENHYLQFAVQWSSIALLYYDYALTFPAEVQYIWRARSFRLSTILYFFCRYALLANVLYLLGIAGKFDLDQYVNNKLCCNTVYKVVGAMSVLGRAAVIIVFTGRAYAVWSQSRIVLGILGSLGLACFILDCMHVPGLVCGGPVGSNIHVGTLAFSFVLTIVVCVFEILAAFITVWRSVQAVVGPTNIRTNTFSFLLFEQGILSFCFVAIFTTVAAILNFRTPNGFLERLLNAFSLPLTCLIIARFILHLREWDAQKLKGSQDKSVQDHTMTTFQAVGRAVNSVAEEFGDDPVVQARQVHEVVVEEHDLEEFEVGTP